MKSTQTWFWMRQATTRAEMQIKVRVPDTTPAPKARDAKA
jgi:hypothetical protein